MSQVKIIGTSHIARESLEKVTKEIENGNYDIICLELDRQRLYSLLNNEKTKPTIRDAFRVGIKGYIFAMIGAWAEKKLGKYVGVQPGEEMITAYRLAKKQNIKIALIDQQIDITLKRFSKEITWKEKWRFIVDIMKGIITRKPEFDIDLTKIPSEKVVRMLIKRVKERYPNLYKVLVSERNEIMAHNIKAISEQNPEKNILAIVGAGHEKEFEQLLKDRITYNFSTG
jgi:pheromone shutdown-related protein TraB